MNNVSQTGLRSSWCCRRRSQRLWSRWRLIWSSCRRASRSERSWTVSHRSSAPHSTQHTSSFLQTSTIWPRRNWKENSKWSKESTVVEVVLSKPIKSYRVFYDLPSSQEWSRGEKCNAANESHAWERWAEGEKKVQLCASESAVAGWKYTPGSVVLYYFNWLFIHKV